MLPRIPPGYRLALSLVSYTSIAVTLPSRALKSFERPPQKVERSRTCVNLSDGSWLRTGVVPSLGTYFTT